MRTRPPRQACASLPARAPRYAAAGSPAAASSGGGNSASARRDRGFRRGGTRHLQVRGATAWTLPFVTGGRCGRVSALGWPSCWPGGRAR
eukprot:scaffold290057_cov33-Tisochrysis_lutea.AAC.4